MDIVSKINFLVIQIAVIFFAAWMGGRIFDRIKLPAVLGEILSGVLIGPFGLGKIPFWGFPFGLFSQQAEFPVSVELYSLATIASIVLLFLVGLQTDMDTFIQFSLAGFVVGFSGVIVSFILGDIAGILFAQYALGKTYSFTHPMCLFFGVISTATSVSISARLLSEKKRMNEADGVTILSAAVIDDVLGIITLAIIIGIAQSQHVGWENVSWIALKACGIWLGTMAIGLSFSRQVSTFLKKNVKDNPTIALMCLSLALLLSGIFEKSGLAMIIGAYTMGLSFSKTDLSFVIQEGIDTLQRFLVPIFFCVMGMLVDVETLISPKILTLGSIYILLSILGKLIGCGGPALFLNFNLRGALRIGVGMIPRGEVALIVAGVALSKGIIDHDAFSMAMLMTFATTLITPPILSMLLQKNGPVLRKNPPQKRPLEVIHFNLPTPETAEFVHRKVLEAFRADGFHAHWQEYGLYFLRKNSMFITMRYSLRHIEFECLSQDRAFIHTLFYEVISDLEHFMKNLKTFSGKAEVSKKIFDAHDVVLEGRPRCFRQLSPLAVTKNLQGNTKNEILEELVELTITSGQIDQVLREEIIKVLQERESSVSTGMQNGIAVPHAKIDKIPRMVLAVGLKKSGVNFMSLDNEPARIFILILIPKANPQEYLQHLSEIIRFLSHEKNREALLAARTNSELVGILKGKLLAGK